MHVTMVNIQVKPEYISEFIEASRINHEASVQELGNQRFDVLQSAEDSTRFVLYEAYLSQEAAASHKTTTHYQTWRDTVADWMDSPREGLVYQGLYPDTEE